MRTLIEAVDALGAMILACPFRSAPDPVVESYEITRLLDSKAPRLVAAALPPKKALVCLEGILLQVQMMRAFLRAVAEADSEAEAVVAATAALARFSEEPPESSESDDGEATIEENAASEAQHDHREAHSVVSSLLASVRSPRGRKSAALEALAAAVGSPHGGAFVERVAALGGLATLLESLADADEASTVHCLCVLGHSRLLDRSIVARCSAKAVVEQSLDALRRRASPRLVGLAVVAAATFAHRDSRAAAALADAGGCRRIVASLLRLSAPDDDVRAALAAGCWALGTIATLSGLRADAIRVCLATTVRDAGAPDLFAETLARFPNTYAARNAALARAQLSRALDEAAPRHSSYCAVA